MKKSAQTDYYDIIKKELEDFCVSCGIPAPAFSVDSVTDESRAVLHFDGFEAMLYFGDMMPYGYAFLEDLREDIAEYCLLTRFKFNFSKTYFSPYDIHNVLGCNTFRTLDFHLIRDENSLRKSISAILSFVGGNSKAISDIAYDMESQRKLTQNYEYDMSVVSPKITAFNLKDDFRKYSEKHESRFNSHGDAESMIRFVAAGKSDALKRYFKRAEKKGKLTTFEKRYRDHLEKNGYQVPLGDFAMEVKAESKRNIKTTLINVVSAILAAIVTIFLFVVTEVIVDENLGYTVIGAGDDRMIVFFPVMLCFWNMFREGVRKIVVGESFSSKISRKANKTVSLVLLVAEIAVIIGCSAYYYHIGYKPVALAQDGIYYGSVKDGEVLPFDTDKVEFFYIDGYVDYYAETITRDEDSAVLYIVAEGNFEGHGIDAFDTPEDRQKVIDALKENAVEIKVISTYEEYDKLFVGE